MAISIGSVSQMLKCGELSIANLVYKAKSGGVLDTSGGSSFKRAFDENGVIIEGASPYWTIWGVPEIDETSSPGSFYLPMGNLLNIDNFITKQLTFAINGLNSKKAAILDSSLPFANLHQFDSSIYNHNELCFLPEVNGINAQYDSGSSLITCNVIFDKEKSSLLVSKLNKITENEDRYKIGLALSYDQSNLIPLNTWPIDPSWEIQNGVLFFNKILDQYTDIPEDVYFSFRVSALYQSGIYANIIFAPMNGDSLSAIGSWIHVPTKMSGVYKYTNLHIPYRPGGAYATLDVSIEVHYEWNNDNIIAVTGYTVYAYILNSKVDRENDFVINGRLSASVIDGSGSINESGLFGTVLLDNLTIPAGSDSVTKRYDKYTSYDSITQEEWESLVGISLWGFTYSGEDVGEVVIHPNEIIKPNSL